VTVIGLLGLVFTLIFFGLIIIFTFAGRNRPGIELRDIPVFNKVRRAIELTVEAGSRLHISLGRGSISGSESAAAFVGLSMLEQMTTSASTGDSPPIATSGDPALAILAQDTLKKAYQEMGMIDQFERTSSQLSGVTPFSYAAGANPVVRDKKSTTSILIGNFGIEVALLTHGSERSGNMTLAGTDDIAAQAVLYATADEILIGEELFAGGAYVDAGPVHTASLRAQDVIRWLLVVVILSGILLKLLSLDQVITNIFKGLL
jgi:hypothetical protein